MDSTDFPESERVLLAGGIRGIQREQGSVRRKLSLNIFAIRMSITDDETLRKNSLNCSAATGSSLTCNMFLTKCRAFGAHSSISTHFPA